VIVDIGVAVGSEDFDCEGIDSFHEEDSDFVFV
jgi:hypothetical protein